jgi:hypothetical protein
MATSNQRSKAMKIQTYAKAKAWARHQSLQTGIKHIVVYTYYQTWDNPKKIKTWTVKINNS